MDAWVIFRKARVALFCFLVFICFAWTALFAFFLFHEWSHFSRFQKILVPCLLSLYGFTAILLYLMVVIHFRLWWDVARLFVLLLAHTGSSVLFTIYSPSFPCRGIGTETACKKFVYAIFIGCWVLSGIILCFVIALGVMAFIPRPVESLQETEDSEFNVPSTPASFKAGSPMDGLSFYSVNTRTGLVTYNDAGKSPVSASSPVNSAYGQTITMGPPRLWNGFESPNLVYNNTYGGTVSMRNAPTEHTTTISGSPRVDSFRLLGKPSPPPTSIYPRARPSAGGKNSSIAENRLNQSSALPGLKRNALSPISTHGLPPRVATPLGLATEHSPTLYSVLSHYLVPTSPGDHSQREQTYPDPARMSTPSIYSVYSTAASVYPTWVEPTPHVPPLPDIARFQDSNSYSGRNGPSSGNNAPFATTGSNTPLTPKRSEPHRAVRHYGALRAHQSHHSPVKESSLSRTGSNKQLLDQTQWRQLVLNAAAKP